MRFVVAVLMVTACGPLGPVTKDAGTGGGFTTAGGFVTTGGGVATAGGTTAGGAATAGGSAGGSTAGGTTTAGGSAGGSATGGGLGPFVWSNIALTPAPGSLSEAKAVSARTGEAYVGLDSGKLYRSTGGLFQEVAGFSNSGVRDVHVTSSGRVFTISAGRSAGYCAANCDVGANHVSRPLTPTDETFLDLCGRGEHVYALAERPIEIGVLYEFDFGSTQWNKVSNNVGASNTERCEVGANGEVFIVGRDVIARYENGALTPEPVDLMGQGAAGWEAIALAIVDGGIADGFIVGAMGGQRSARRNSQTASWTAQPLLTQGGFTEVLAIAPGEFLAAGFGTVAAPQLRFAWWTGSAWAPPPVAPPNTFNLIMSSAVANEREVFLVGRDSSSYSVVRGRR